jgi:hypothetical protein
MRPLLLIARRSIQKQALIDALAAFTGDGKAAAGPSIDVIL